MNKPTIKCPACGFWHEGYGTTPTPPAKAGDGLVEHSVYESAVRGRKEFRQLYRDERDKRRSLAAQLKEAREALERIMKAEPVEYGHYDEQYIGVFETARQVLRKLEETKPGSPENKPDR